MLGVESLPVALARPIPVITFLLLALMPWTALAATTESASHAAQLRVLERVFIEPPYRTQRDGSANARSNCGPAALGMVLEGYGVRVPTLEVRRLTHTYQATWPGRGGTALQHIAQVAEDFRVPSHGLYDDSGAFHRWTVDEINEQMREGRWVIPLVRWNYLPGHEDSPVRWGHYILLYAEQDGGFLYHDPAFDPIEAGRSRWISQAQLDRAMAPVLVPRQAVALGGLPQPVAVSATRQRPSASELALRALFAGLSE